MADQIDLTDMKGGAWGGGSLKPGWEFKDKSDVCAKTEACGTEPENFNLVKERDLSTFPVCPQDLSLQAFVAIYTGFICEFSFSL